MGKLLGIDYGKKNIGIALSDEEGRLAFPHEILKNDRHLLETVKNICSVESVSEIVIGESLDYKGRENTIMDDIHNFKKALEEGTSLSVNFEPEFLTSRQARPAKAGPKRRARMVRKEKVQPLDASAAAIILQSYLDKRQEKNNGEN